MGKPLFRQKKGSLFQHRDRWMVPGIMYLKEERDNSAMLSYAAQRIGFLLHLHHAACSDTTTADSAHAIPTAKERAGQRMSSLHTKGPAPAALRAESAGPLSP